MIFNCVGLPLPRAVRKKLQHSGSRTFKLAETKLAARNSSQLNLTHPTSSHSQMPEASCQRLFLQLATLAA